ncbi:MAG: STAS domain-containing protein [Xanthomonadales bacterium]|nr:STAS domain-containing protein [Xanthomonadales bacterium]
MSAAFVLERTGPGTARLSGRVGYEEAAAAFLRADALLEGASASMELDAADLRDVDSATLGVLLAWVARAARQGITLRVRQPPQGLRALAHLCGTEALLGI